MISANKYAAEAVGHGFNHGVSNFQPPWLCGYMVIWLHECRVNIWIFHINFWSSPIYWLITAETPTRHIHTIQYESFLPWNTGNSCCVILLWCSAYGETVTSPWTYRLHVQCQRLWWVHLWESYSNYFIHFTIQGEDWLMRTEYMWLGDLRPCASICDLPPGPNIESLFQFCYDQCPGRHYSQ